MGYLLDSLLRFQLCFVFEFTENCWLYIAHCLHIDSPLRLELSLVFGFTENVMGSHRLTGCTLHTHSLALLSFAFV